MSETYNGAYAELIAQPEMILIVEDEPVSSEMLQTLLETRGYATRVAANGREAMHSVAVEPPDLILADAVMPQMNGFELIEKLKSDASTATIPIIMVTGLSDMESRIRALELGAADFLLKPINPQELRMRVQNHLGLKRYADILKHANFALEDKVRERTIQLRAGNRETILLLMSAAEYRDDDTGIHLRHISHLTAALAKGMDMGDAYVDRIFYASPMHDIGKIGVPDSILLKKGPLDESEWRVMKTHPELGKRILGAGTNEYLRMGSEIAYSHHERWDGSGYPAGASGYAVPLSGYIMAICDQYDALRSERPYKPAFDHETAVRIITQGDGRTRPEHFHPRVLSAFKAQAARLERVYLDVT